MQSYKQSYDFRLKLAQARNDRLMENQNVDVQELVNKYKEEIAHLKIQVDKNPQLAERHAKVMELESRTVQVESHKLLEKVLEHLEKAALFNEEY